MDARRKEDVVVDRNWLASLARFELRDLALLIALVVWLVVPRPDSEARASITVVKEDLKKLDAEKLNADVAAERYKALSDKLDALSKQIDSLDRKIDSKEK